MSDLILVSWEEFYAYVGPRDIILHLEPTFTNWETRDRRLVGRSFPGWRNSEDPKAYMLERSRARDAIVDANASREAKAPLCGDANNPTADPSP